MKLTCHRPSLAAALQIVSGVVPSRTPREILRNVCLQVRAGKAVLVGTDSEIGVRQEVDQVETDSTGEVLLPTSRVISILRELQDDQIVLDAAERSVQIKGGHSEFTLSTEDPAEFPQVTDFADQNYFVLPAKTFREMIRRTQFATDVESTRYALGGILIELNPEKATLAATDSRRLAVVSCLCRAVGEANVAAATPVVPSKAMSLIERSLPDSDEAQVQIAIRANDVVVRCGGSTIYSRLVEGRFPRYADVIPREFRSRIDLVVGPFYSAVRQAQIVTSEETRGVEFRFSNGLLTMASRAAEIGQSNVELPVSYDGADLTIIFDPKFIADFLRVLEPATSVTLNLIDGESPAVFTTDDHYRYVVMPLSRDQ